MNKDTPEDLLVGRALMFEEAYKEAMECLQSYSEVIRAFAGYLPDSPYLLLLRDYLPPELQDEYDLISKNINFIRDKMSEV